MAFPDPEMDYSEAIPQATPQVEQLIKSHEIQEKLGLSDRKNFRKNYLNL